MGKKFKGKACAYCGTGDAGTADHVFAREFFLLEDRNNLPKVPACPRCNREKSKLEHYATAVLPLAGRHPAAIQNCLENAPRRLQKNEPLRSELDRGRGQRWGTSPAGLIVPETTLPVDPKLLTGLYSYIAAGLSWYHWEVHVLPNNLAVQFLTSESDRCLRSTLIPRPDCIPVERNLGNGTVIYNGFRLSSNFLGVAVWFISIYGVHFGNENASVGVCRKVGVFITFLN